MKIWPESYQSEDWAISFATVGIMIDECFSTVVHAARPSGRTVVTSELSLDLACPSIGAVTALVADGEVLSAGEDRALARASLRSDEAALIATATTWCRFIEDGHDEHEPYPAAETPPPDLRLSTMLETRIREDRREAQARFSPSPECANDLGTLHGGIAVAVTIEMGLEWLAMLYGPAPSISSVRVNFLRPISLSGVLAIAATPIHTGRMLAVANISSRDESGRLMTTATITGAPPSAAGERQG